MFLFLVLGICHKFPFLQLAQNHIKSWRKIKGKLVKLYNQFHHVTMSFKKGRKVCLFTGSTAVTFLCFLRVSLFLRNQPRERKGDEKGNNLLITTLTHCAIHSLSTQPFNLFLLPLNLSSTTNHFSSLTFLINSISWLMLVCRKISSRENDGIQ